MSHEPSPISPMNFPPPQNIKHLSLSEAEPLILMSDMHRGDGTSSDDFAHNSLLYKCALTYYLENNFTYIELGDAEELWENQSFDQIYITHSSIYEILARFHDPDPSKTRYIKIWGNHDLKWRSDPAPLQQLFPGITLYEAVILDNHILMVHGHQADPKCSGFWANVSKFFVGGIWPWMQRLGIKDPTRAANNPGRANSTDQKLHQRAVKNGQGIQTVIAGHTHRPVYRNLSLTEMKLLDSGIEITLGQDGKPEFTLIKWSHSAQPVTTRGPDPSSREQNLTIGRTVLEHS